MDLDIRELGKYGEMSKDYTSEYKEFQELTIYTPSLVGNCGKCGGSCGHCGGQCGACKSSSGIVEKLKKLKD